jgi:dTDP-glucose pyrophosphorylase
MTNMKPINILIPMAGLGSRFRIAGYTDPKPFINIKGKTMIERVLDNLCVPNAHYILIAREEDITKRTELVKSIEQKYNARFIAINQLTEGTACTVLFARKLINNDIPLLIANSDQIVDFDINSFIADADSRRLDGSILTFIDEEKNPKWSFAKVDENELVVEVQEKKPISEFATVGIYFFKKGKTFVDAAIDMIIQNDRTNNEFYTCPTYNYAIKNGCKVGVFNILQNKMHGIGTPEDLEKYLPLI